MECRMLLAVCILSMLCLQLGKSQPSITRRVTELCSSLRGIPKGKTPKGTAPNDYYDEYPDNVPTGAGPKGKTPKGASPNDYYDEYPDNVPTGAGPKGKTPKGASPNDYYDDYADNVPPKGSPKGRTPTKNPLVNDYGDPEYDDNALGLPEGPDTPGNRGNPNLPKKKPELPTINLTVVCGGKTTRRVVK